MVSKTAIAALAVSVIGVVAIGAVAASKAKGSPNPKPIPMGETFLVPDCESCGTLDISVPFTNVETGVVVDISSGTGGGLDVTFNGKSSYTLSVPSSVSGHNFLYWVVFGPNGQEPEVTSTTLVVPAGTYAIPSTQIIAYYS